jgi:hypothetical protein
VRIVRPVVQLPVYGVLHLGHYLTRNTIPCISLVCTRYHPAVSLVFPSNPRRRCDDATPRQAGHDPTVLQRMIIEQCVVLSLRIHLLDREFLKQRWMTEHNSHEYITLVDALSRSYQQLGIHGAASPDPDPPA